VHFHSSFGWSIGRALERAGHKVHIFDYRRNPFSSFPGARAWYSRRVMPEALFRTAAQLRPDLMLLAKAELVPGDAVSRIRKRTGCRAVNWFPDSRLFSYRNLMSQLPHLDAFFGKNKDDLQRLRLLGQNNGHFLLHCADRELHTEIVTTEDELSWYRCEVALVGSYYPYRDFFLSKLQNFDFHIWGPGWERSRMAERKGVVMGCDARSFEQAKVFRAATVNINLHHFDDTGCLNQRVFDINGSGGCQLMDGPRDMESTFEIPEELDTFASIDELNWKIRQILATPERARQMARRARAKTAACHTYDHRIAEILGVLRI